jgi:hypothetical protein
LFIIPSSKLHIINEEFYDLLLLIREEMGFGGIVKIYGNFEKKVFDSGLIIFIIESFIFLILVVIRLIYGGFKNKFIILSIIFYILSAILHCIFLVLSFLIFLFSILFLLSIQNKSLLNILYYIYTVITIKLVFQIVFAIFKIMLFTANIVFLIKNIIYYFDIIKSRKQISDNIVKNNLEKEIVFEYTDLNNNKKRLAEFRMQGFPKYLFFKLEGANKNKILIQKTEIGAIEVNNTE